MGCDGGSIPRRDEMVKLKKKAQKADKAEELQARWKYCALSGQELKPPIVACELGRLYNKEAVLLALLDKASLPEVARHIRSLKDVTLIQLTVNPSYKPSSKADAYNDTQASEYVCPVTGLEMSGRYRFVYQRGCGCVISEKALREVPSENCHKCGAEIREENVVRINASEEEEKRMRELMEERRRQAKMTKRKRKLAADQEAVVASSSSVGSSSSVSSSEEASATSSGASSGSDKETPPPPPAPSSVPPQGKKMKQAAPATADPSSKKPSKKKRPTAAGELTNGAVASRPGVNKLTKPPAVEEEDGGGERDAVLEMAEGRRVYKSLFSSNNPQRTKEQTSNWVTFFPYH